MGLLNMIKRLIGIVQLCARTDVLPASTTWYVSLLVPEQVVAGGVDDLGAATGLNGCRGRCRG